MNNNNLFSTIRNILLGVLLLSGISLGIKKFDLLGFESPENIRSNAQLNQNVVSSRMTYGRFLEYLEMGWVKQVDLYENSRNAIVQASSPELGNRPQTIRVEIPVGASQLIQKLKEYNIDFDAHPTEQKNVFVSIASNILLPILFIGGLVYLFQNSENFGGAGGQSPMSLGKSTARFEKKPDTGVTFKDIAGIDEAKQEFEADVQRRRTGLRHNEQLRESMKTMIKSIVSVNEDTTLDYDISNEAIDELKKINKKIKINENSSTQKKRMNVLNHMESVKRKRGRMLHDVMCKIIDEQADIYGFVLETTKVRSGSNGSKL